MLRFLSTIFFIAFFAMACKTPQNTHNNNKKNSNLDEPKLIQVDTHQNRIDTSIVQEWSKPSDFSTLIEMETTLGIMKIELFATTNGHRENFLENIKKGVYNGTLYHRVIKGFMAQGGDPATKNAKPGQRLGGGNDKQIPHEVNTDYFHIKGALAAARMPDEMNPEKKSSAFQFYIVEGRAVSENQLDQNERKYNIVYGNQQRTLYKMYGGTPQLDMEYTVFGRVYEGLEVLDAIVKEATDNFDRPLKDVKIIKMQVLN